MDIYQRKLWVFLLVSVLLLVAGLMKYRPTEGFVDSGIGGVTMANLSTQARDAAPTTSEVKNHYKNLLLFAANDIKLQGTSGLRILADFRDRVYGPRDFRPNLTVEDFTANWPDWLPAIETTIKEPIPSVSDAVTAELRMLAYLQRYYPQEPNVDEQTGSTIRNLIEDFGLRFVFETGPVSLRPDFLAQPLIQNWVNPVRV